MRMDKIVHYVIQIVILVFLQQQLPAMGVTLVNFYRDKLALTLASLLSLEIFKLILVNFANGSVFCVMIVHLVINAI